MAGFPNYTYPAYGGYNPVTPFAPAPQVYQPMQQPAPQPVQAAQTVGSTNTQPNFFCRPVASREEALGVPVDFMGAPMFFPDLAHNVIYMKRFNSNTRAILDFLTQSKIDSLQAENQSLKLAASQANQNSYLTATLDAQTSELIRRINPMPVPAYQVPAPYPYCGAYNNGCGCGC